MDLWPKYYHGPRQSITVLQRNRLRLSRAGVFLSRHRTVAGAILAAQQDADDRDTEGTYRIRVDGGLLMEFEIVPRADVTIRFSTNAPAFAYPPGAGMAAEASAPSAFQDSNDVEATINGVAVSGNSGSVAVGEFALLTIPDITVGVGSTHDMSQYILDPQGELISTSIINLNAAYATYDDTTLLLTGVQETPTPQTNVQLGVTYGDSFFPLTLDGLSGAGRLGFYIDYSELATTGTHNFYVCRTHGSTGAVTCSYSSGGDSHTNVSGTLSWEDQDISIKRIQVTVPSKNNGDHRIWISLSSPTGGAALHFGSAYTIAYGVIDDDTVASDSDAVFFDSDALTNGSGTAASPYDNIYDAITNVGSKRTIYGAGSFTPDGTNTDAHLGGGTINVITPPPSRASEATRGYIRQWPGQTNFEVVGDLINENCGGFSDSSNGTGSFWTWRKVDFSDIDYEAGNGWGGGIGFSYTDAAAFNVEHCTFDNLNAGTGNNIAAIMPWGSDGVKIWRCTANNIKVAQAITQNSAGICQIYNSDNVSVQRCTMTNTKYGTYHKKVSPGEVGTEVSMSCRFNLYDGCSHLYGISDGSDGSHSYSIFQSNVAKDTVYEGYGTRHTTADNTNLGVKAGWWCNNVYDAIDNSADSPAVLLNNANGLIMFNNIMNACSQVWREPIDDSPNNQMEYIDYNHENGTLTAASKYTWRGTAYSTASALNTASGFEGNATTGTPDFVNAASNDYSLGGSSNASGNGVDGSDHGVYLTGIEVIGA